MRLTKEVIELLKDRARRGHLQTLLSDPLTNGVLTDLVALGHKLGSGASWTDIARSFNLQGGRATMRQYADAILDRNYRAQNYASDERYVDAVSSVINDFLLESVGKNHRTFATGSAQDIDRALDRPYFTNTIGRFIGKLIAVTIKADTVHDLGTSYASVSTAAESVATAIYDKFAQRFLDTGKAKKEDVLRIISENFNTLVSV